MAEQTPRKKSATKRSTAKSATKKSTVKKRTTKKRAPNRKIARDYRHEDEALLRPESGAQDTFPSSKRKSPKTYRYDSSLSPELAWDETAERDKAEGLIDEILQANDLNKAQQAAQTLKSMSSPFLNWAGKAERESITVPTLPLFTHEKISTHAVLETLKRRHPKRKETLDLFGEGDKSVGEKIRGAYEHLNGWQNRLILGDSLQIMNSLLEYEGLGGQVQTVYMDPPYGIRFGSNFQPFVRRRDVKDGDDNSISREPEMVQAYRDTWTLGIHSWLTYMRDRLLLARELLTSSGSCFVQISDENVHYVREIMDEVFGRENFVSSICFRTKKMPLNKSILDTISNSIIWYAKRRENIKFIPLFEDKKVEDGFGYIEDQDGGVRKVEDTDSLEKAKMLLPLNLNSSGLTESCVFDVEFDGGTFRPRKNHSWVTNEGGMKSLIEKGRIFSSGTSIYYKLYHSDYPVKKITNMWSDTMGAFKKQYVVQTSEKVIQRCILMTTDPGDLVLDPTCGSGTTAYVAEHWGRRWITTDVSRVPLAIARQRLLTATYPYYELKDEQRGPAGGFIYKRERNKKGEEVGGIVPHITLGSIANDEPPAEEVLVDKPGKVGSTVRITGPFCVEAVLPTPLSPESDKGKPRQVRESRPSQEEDGYIPRMVKALGMSSELRLQNNETLKLTDVRPPAKSMNLHAEAQCKLAGNGKTERIAVAFGPENGPISERAVVDAGKEANHKGYNRLLVIAFAIEPDARTTTEQGEETFNIPALYAQATPDLMMGDLLKSTRYSQLFAVTGLPDVALDKLDEKDDDGGNLWQVTLNGLDLFDPTTMEPNSLKGNDVPCWMLDTDYDGQCFRAGQIFFPRTSAWDNIRKAIRADFDDAVWECLKGDTSAPFIPGEQIAVKVLDDRGNELLVVKPVEK